MALRNSTCMSSPHHVRTYIYTCYTGTLYPIPGVHISVTTPRKITHTLDTPFLQQQPLSPNQGGHTHNDIWYGRFGMIASKYIQGTHRSAYSVRPSHRREEQLRNSPAGVCYPARYAVGAISICFPLPFPPPLPLSFRL